MVQPITPAPAPSWKDPAHNPPSPPLCRTPLPLLPIMADSHLTRSPRSVAKVLGTGFIPAELAAILTEHSRTVRKDGSARTPEERTEQGLHAFLSSLVLGEMPVPSL